MNDIRKAAQAALEALYQAREHVTVHTDGPWQKVETDCHAAITALRAALEAQEVEPVAWSLTYLGEHGGNFYGIESRAHDELKRLNRLYPSDAAKRAVVPLYASPPQPREPVPGMADVLARCIAGIDHLAELARQWEPDHSSGADRRGWVLAKDARDDAEQLRVGIASAQPRDPVRLTDAQHRSAQCNRTRTKRRG